MASPHDHGSTCDALPPDIATEVEDKAPMLTIQDVREILEVILPRRRITKKDILEIIGKKHKVRESARWSHHKRNSK